jgi:hypothetical protein
LRHQRKETTMAVAADERMLHVRFEGRSVDIPMRELHLPYRTEDPEVRRAAARYLDVAESRLSDCVLERHATGNWTLRPEAVFG